MSESIVSRDTIALQAARAAETSIKTGAQAQNPYCQHLEPEHHAEFARRFYCALQRLEAPADCEGSA